jgi:hypothetical protein
VVDEVVDGSVVATFGAAGAGAGVLVAVDGPTVMSICAA